MQIKVSKCGRATWFHSWS